MCWLVQQSQGDCYLWVVTNNANGVQCWSIFQRKSRSLLGHEKTDTWYSLWQYYKRQNASHITLLVNLGKSRKTAFPLSAVIRTHSGHNTLAADARMIKAPNEQAHLVFLQHRTFFLSTLIASASTEVPKPRRRETALSILASIVGAAVGQGSRPGVSSVSWVPSLYLVKGQRWRAVVSANIPKICFILSEYCLHWFLYTRADESSQMYYWEGNGQRICSLLEEIYCLYHCSTSEICIKEWQDNSLFVCRKQK